MMKRVLVIVIACVCGMALVSCKAKPPKPAKAKKLVVEHFKELGYEVECVNMGEYRKLGEKQWASDMDIKLQNNAETLPFEVEFKSIRRGYELKCGYEYMLELNDLIAKEVNTIV